MPDMPEYQRLFDENSKSRRTIADALEMLREFAGFDEGDRAKISIGPLRLPSGDVVGLVDVRFDDPLRKKVWIVSLPTSAQFRAICPGSSRRKRFDIARLDEAAVDAEAAVLLTDETKLRAVEMIPTCSLSDPTRTRLAHFALHNCDHRSRGALLSQSAA
jgi:hypothetical protein